MIRIGYAAKSGTSSEEADEPIEILPRGRCRPVVAATRAAAPRCSFAQEQFWFVDQVTPGNLAYNFSWPIRLLGRLDTHALERALVEVVRRHESLRTGFAVEDGQPVQVIGPAPVTSRSNGSTSRRSRTRGVAQRLVDEETRRPFDLRSARALSSSADPTRRTRPHPPDRRPSHRLRRMVEGRALSRLERPLRGLRSRAVRRRSPEPRSSTPTSLSGSVRTSADGSSVAGGACPLGE